MAFVVAGWHLFYNAALVVQILLATRELQLAPQTVGWSYVAVGVGTGAGQQPGASHQPLDGAGPCLVLGFGICGVGWSLQLRWRLAGAARRGQLCLDAVCLGRGRGADVHQLPVAAAVGHASPDAGAHDQHHAVAHLAACRAGALLGAGWASMWACARRWHLPAWAR